MDKRRVSEFLPTAVEKLKGKQLKRNQFSQMGATIIMSGVLPAVAYYSKEERKKYLEVVKAVSGIDLSVGNAKQKVSEREEEIILDAIVAIKLALDALETPEKEENDSKGDNKNGGKTVQFERTE